MDAKLKEITDSIEQGIKDLFESDRYKQYLGTMSRFHQYSLNNTMLIFMQKPDATLVASFLKWRDQFGRNVKRGEKGIKIIAPMTSKRRVEVKKLDPVTHKPILDSSGKAVTEEKEISVQTYRPVTVFDVSQTEGKPLPELVTDMSGNVARYELFMKALERTSPVPVSIEPITNGSDGFFSRTEQRIALREGMSEIQTVSVAIHEIAHSRLHNDEEAKKDRRTKEVEAESIAYSVCQYHGLQTGENSLGYIATWSKDKELPELRASLETINKTASGIITDIDRHFALVLKEYDVVLEAFAADCDAYIRENTASPFPLESSAEAIARMVEDIKSGRSGDIREDFSRVAAQPPDELLCRLDEIEKIYPPAEREAVFLLDNENYLHICEGLEGYCYFLYDSTLRELDMGGIEASESIDTAYTEALNLLDLRPSTTQKVPLDILDQIADVRQADIESYISANIRERRGDVFDRPSVMDRLRQPPPGKISPRTAELSEAR